MSSDLPKTCMQNWLRSLEWVRLTKDLYAELIAFVRVSSWERIREIEVFRVRGMGFPWAGTCRDDRVRKSQFVERVCEWIRRLERSSSRDWDAWVRGISHERCSLIALRCSMCRNACCSVCCSVCCNACCTRSSIVSLKSQTSTRAPREMQ